MDSARVISYLDRLILLCLCVLVVFLPIAHTESVRAFALGIPAGLWIIKSILAGRPLFSRTALDLPLFFFTIIAGFSVLTAVDPAYSLEEWVGEWLIGLFLFYLVVNNFRHSHMKYLLGSLLGGNLLMVGYGFYDFVHRGGVLLDYHVRAGSLHSGFGTFGTYLVTVLPYILVAIFFVRRTSLRLFLSLLFALNILALFLTHSRGSWVAVAVLLVAAGWIFAPRKLLAAGLAALFLLLIFLAPGAILKHYAGITPPGGAPAQIETFSARWELTKFVKEKLGENPFRMIGYGPRSFVKKYHEFSSQYQGALLSHAHNTFLNIALSTGVQGLVVFCFFIAMLLRTCRFRAAGEIIPLFRFYFLSTFLMVVIYLVRNLSDDFFSDDSALLFWFLSGAALGIKKEEAADKEYEARMGVAFVEEIPAREKAFLFRRWGRRETR
ncbi:MAG TPA: O-antigen ligase family protein [Thermodesulfobacteriota bacterium]|nr:O-antigen ligase family protein [Thermodesulfobacteriota bacterium]